MKTPKTKFGKYFQKSVLHLSKSKLVFLIISVIEFMEILVCLLDYQDFFFLLNQNYYDTRTQLAKLLLSIIPYSYYFEYFIAKNNFNTVYIAISIYAFLIILFFIYLIFGKESNEEIQQNTPLTSIIDKICINFFDLFLFRLAPLYGINIIVHTIFKILQIRSYSITEIILLFLLVLLLVFVVILHYDYFSNVCIWNNFKVIETCFSKYPYEIFYSKKYDNIMFTLKLLIALTKNYLDYNNYVANFQVIFLTLLIEIIFFGFAFYTIYLLFFSKNVLYFYLNFYNKVRIFLLLFMIEALIIRFGLHSSYDYIPYLTFMFMFFIFNLYIIISVLDSYILTSAIKSQNYIGVCWFIQSNDINIQHFTIEWITNHRINCILDINQCPICSKLKIDFDTYSEERLKLLKNDNNKVNNNDDYKNHKKSIIKKRNVIKKTMISEIFPPFSFFKNLLKLAEKSRKFMSEDDLIRLDLLHIIVLFYSEKEIDYYFYTKLCFLFIKYKENSQVLMTLILIFEIMYNESVSKNQKYEILKKTEKLNHALEKYLKEYNYFILYSDKSPINYFNTSKKYKKFKDLFKTIYVYFKKNVECNYELILMRYVYELLVNQKSKNMQSFDLNNYADFIEYHYINNKSFTLKNIIDQDIFIILKGSKEILKYQNKNFKSLFPSEFQNDAINRFKKKLINLDIKETNSLFEYTINSLESKKFGFVDSFKMKYIIYPTHLINELYIQVNYIVGYNNIIIFEENEDRVDLLFSFSSKLYKILGIYPSDIYLLKKAGIYIYFNDIFIKSDKNKNNQDGKYFYTFKYDTYLLLLKNLLNHDVLKDSPNYKQILDKLQELKTTNEEEKKIKFQLIKKWEYKTKTNKLYKFFSIKEIRKKTELSKNNSYISKNLVKLNSDNDEESTSDSDEYKFEHLKKNSFEGKGMIMADCTLSSSVSQNESEESGKQKGKKDEKLDEKIIKKQQLEKYTYVLLFFSITLIIITVIFLILETNENNHFRKVIDLYTDFRQFKRGIERFPLTLLSNFQIYYKENTSINIYEQYSKNLGKKNEILKNNILSDVFIQELILKIDFVIDSFNNYQKAIHILGSTLAEKINSLTGFTYNIYSEDNTILCRSYNVSLLILFRSYLNVISTLLKNGDFYGKEFPLVNLTILDNENTLVDTVIPYNTEISKTLKKMFLLSFSYPYSHSGLVNTVDIILNENREIINHITKILVIFFGVLIILHFILGLIAILFIISFTNILKLNISDSNKLFEDKKFLEFHQRRIEQIKIMKNLYSENPLKIADKIDVIEEFYKRKKTQESKKASNINVTNIINTNILSEKKQNINESIKDDKNEISKKNENKNIISFNSEPEIFNNENKYKNNKNFDFKEIQFNEIKISSKNIELTRKQFSSILKIQYLFVYISFGIYFIYSILLFFLVFLCGIKNLTHLVNYTNYNDSMDGYIYDNANALLFMIQTNSTSFYYGNITDNNRIKDYMEEGIESLYESIIGKEDIEIYKENIFAPVVDLISLNCSDKLIKDKDFINTANKMGFDYDKYFGELCKYFPVAQSGSDTQIFHEILYLVEQIYRKFSTNQNFEYIFQEYLNQTQLYDLFTLILTFNKIHRNYFNVYIFQDEVDGVLDYFSLLMYIYLVISVVLEIIIFLVVYVGIIKEVKRKDALIINFSESLKYE